MLSALFATKSLLKLGSDERDNLNFMNLIKLAVITFVKIREFYENL